MLDFRALRFPGLIISHDPAQWRTSDYGPEMLHAAAQGRPIRVLCSRRHQDLVHGHARCHQITDDADRCAARPTEPEWSTTWPRLRSLPANSATGPQGLPRRGDLFEPNPRRQGIVRLLAEDVDDSRARHDWNWQPDFDVETFFNDYFLPKIRTTIRLDRRSFRELLVFPAARHAIWRHLI